MSLTNIQVYNGTPISTLLNTGFAGSTTLLAGAAAQAAPTDFLATRAAQWNVVLQAYFAAAPTVGATLDLYVAWGTGTGAGYPGGLGVSPANAYFSGYNTVATAGYTSALPQFEYIGSLVCAPVAGAQVAQLGMVTPKLETGVMILVNNTSVTLGNTAGNLPGIVTFVPIVDEVGV